MGFKDAQKSEIEAVTQEWAAGFNQRDPGKLSTLYDDEAVLWGTLSQKIVATPDGIREYFEKICASPMRLTVVFDEELIRSCGDVMLNSGSYTFSFLSEGKSQPFPARYSLVLRKKGNRWLIVDHHSSARPSAS